MFHLFVAVVFHISSFFLMLVRQLQYKKIWINVINVSAFCNYSYNSRSEITINWTYIVFPKIWYQLHYWHEHWNPSRGGSRTLISGGHYETKIKYFFRDVHVGVWVIIVVVGWLIGFFFRGVIVSIFLGDNCFYSSISLIFIYHNFTPFYIFCQLIYIIISLIMHEIFATDR